MVGASTLPPTPETLPMKWTQATLPWSCPVPWRARTPSHLARLFFFCFVLVVLDRLAADEFDQLVRKLAERRDTHGQKRLNFFWRDRTTVFVDDVLGNQ